MQESLSEIWRLVLSEMENILSKPSFETWLKSTTPLSIKKDTIIIEVPNDFTKMASKSLL